MPGFGQVADVVLLPILGLSSGDRQVLTGMASLGNMRKRGCPTSRFRQQPSGNSMRRPYTFVVDLRLALSIGVLRASHILVGLLQYLV